MSGEALHKLRTELESATQVDELLRILLELEEVKVTRAALSSSKIGMSVGRLRTHASTVVASRSLAVVAKWKRDIGQSAAAPATTGSASRGRSRSPDRGRAPAPSEGADEGQYCGPCCRDDKRNRVREILFRALRGGVPPEQLEMMDAKQASNVCSNVEESLHEVYVSQKADQRAYAAQMRSIRSNLLDKKNPELNIRIYLGAVSASKLATMQPSDMASDAKKRERQKARKDALEACQSDWDLRNIKRAAGQFPCGKCKSDNTTYFQMQTRSSDEPMTTFVNCIECGNRWKF